MERVFFYFERFVFREAHLLQEPGKGCSIGVSYIPNPNGLTEG